MITRYFQLGILLLIYTLIHSVVAWSGPNGRVGIHPSSTLRLLQLIHTHGDRTPSHFVHNDPFGDVSKFWPEGIGQLTIRGQNQMYQVGEFFRNAYRDFLQQRATILSDYIKVQSSGSRRCLESASALVTGLIGGNHEKNNDLKTSPNLDPYWNLTKYWAPVPIRSVYPKGSDSMLDLNPYCPNAELEFADMQCLDPRINLIYSDNQEFFVEISKYAGETINTLKDVNELYRELFIERQHQYHWWKEPYQIWTEDYETYAITRLRELSQLYWTVQFDNRRIQRLFGGELIRQINENIRSYVNGTNRETRLYIYSTHDSKLVSILQAFGVYNRNLIPPGATIVVELHQKVPLLTHLSDYYLRFYYFNETYTNDWAYELKPKVCDHPSEAGSANIQCPLNTYLSSAKALETADWHYECGLRVPTTPGFAVNIALVITNTLLLVTITLMVSLRNTSYLSVVLS